MKRRVNFRIDVTLSNLIQAWKRHPAARLQAEGGKPLSIAAQITVSLRHLFRAWVQQTISANEIKELATLKEAQGYYRVDLPSDLHTLIVSMLPTELSLSELLRASLVILPDLKARKDLERQYLNKGGVGNPELMSDDFLLLWVKHKNLGPATDGVYVVRALRDLELKFQATLKKLDSLSVLFDNYGIEGILQSEVTPKKAAILCLEGRGLRALCKRWDIPAAAQTPDEQLRRLILSHFGYQQE